MTIVIFDILINLIENALIIKTMELFLFNKTKQLYSYLFIIFMTLTSTLVNNYIYPQTLSSLILLILLFIYTFIFLDGDIKNKVLTPIVIFGNILIINVSALIVASLLNANLYEILINLSYSYFVVALLSKLIYFIQYIYLKKFTKQNYLLSKRTWFLLAILLTTCALTVEFTFTKFILYQIDDISFVIILTFQFIIVSSIVFSICSQMDKDNQRFLEQEIYYQTHKYEDKLMGVIKEKIDYINRWNHDIKNHLSTLKKLTVESPLEAEKYAKELFQSEQIINTSNMVLNYILNDKIAYAKSKDVDIRCLIQGELNQNISLVDLNILLGNLLDNAIEATLLTDKRRIDINISDDGFKTLISISNSFNSKTLQNNPSFLSTKRNFTSQGHGLSNIRLICEKYNGIDSIKHENNLFYHTCLLVPK